MKTAIIGLPQVGKTSLFTILTGVASEGRIGGAKAQIGIAKVPDKRIDALVKIFEPPKVTYATVEYVDMPAISKESLQEPSYIASLRAVDAFAHVLRLFEDDTVMHVEGEIDPRRDWRAVEAELILADLQVVENRLERVEKDLKKLKNPDLPREKELLEKCRELLENETPLRTMELEPDDAKRLRGFQFLSEKPMLLVLNLGEEQAPDLAAIEQRYREEWLSDQPKVALTAVCGGIESELAQLPPEDQKSFLESYGLAEPGLDRLIETTYDLLGLMSFLTAGETEVRAWTISKGTTAAKAAGAIHSDFEKKFIRAETIPWETLVALNGYAGAKDKGVLRLEGRDYIVQDGDVLVIRHS
ncbi:MAG: redox-regulated ATPase YchF [Acidobacteria bacterium]|nr:redox-regulated ATPase YchF [Acidobacteriota bacterium]